MKLPPFPGHVLYRCRPGQTRAGQQDLTALVTRVYPDGRCDLRIYTPDSADSILQSRVMPMSPDVQSHCWHTPESGTSKNEIDGLMRDLVSALDRIEALEKRLKPAKAA